MSHPVLSEVMGRGLQRSPTFRQLVMAIEASDLVLQVRLGTGIRPDTGFTQFLSSGHGARFIRITLNIVEANDAAVALLAHELQHAVEIAGEPAVDDPRSYAGFYRAIGFQSCDPPASCFETGAALAAGRRVMRELRD